MQIGIILAFIGSYFLLDKAQSAGLTQYNACLIYLISLIALFLASTLYHSMFCLRRTADVLVIFDHAAIYLLITGTYTPFLRIVLAHKEFQCNTLAIFLWICCTFGIAQTMLYYGPYKPYISLTLYLGMGWVILFCINDLIELLPAEAIYLLFAGGIAYTAGVPFFVTKKHLYHAIWHIFVLIGSLLHFICIYNYVVDFKLPPSRHD